MSADSRTSKVVVKGKAADPIKVCERLQKKSGKKVELISPLPKPPEEKKEETKEEPPKEEKKDEVNHSLLACFYLLLCRCNEYSASTIRYCSQSFSLTNVR